MDELSQYFSRLSNEEKRDNVYAALARLNEEDRRKIIRLSKILIRNMKEKDPNIKFGEVAALELICMLGVGIVENRLRLKK